jgi:hypothetical protein
MQFARRLRDRVMLGEITCSVRIWQRPHVKAGGRYRLGAGEIHVTSVREIEWEKVTPELALRSGFDSVEDLLSVARHGRGDNVYLVEFDFYEPIAR